MEDGLSSQEIIEFFKTYFFMSETEIDTFLTQSNDMWYYDSLLKAFKEVNDVGPESLRLREWMRKKSLSSSDEEIDLYNQVKEDYVSQLKDSMINEAIKSDTKSKDDGKSLDDSDAEKNSKKKKDSTKKKERVKSTRGRPSKGLGATKSDTSMSSSPPKEDLSSHLCPWIKKFNICPLIEKKKACPFGGHERRNSFGN